MNIRNPNVEPLHPDQIKAANLKKRAAMASICVATILVSAKFFAYIYTDAISLMSSLIDSAFDLFASCLTMLSVKKSSEPAGRKHKYGYGKVEAIAATGQAIFVSASAGYLLFEAIQRFANPHQIKDIGLGVDVMLFSIVMTIGLVVYQYRIIKETNSVAIKADHLHYKSDLLMNVAVIGALLLTHYNGWPYIDPIFGVIVSFILIHSAYRIFMEALGILMDKEIPDEDRLKIMSIVDNHSDVLDMHDLRTRNSGNQLFIEFHLEMDGELSISDSHDITEELEREIYNIFPKSDVLIHQEPHGIDDRRIG